MSAIGPRISVGAFAACLLLACGGKVTNDGGTTSATPAQRDDTCLPSPGGGHAAGDDCPTASGTPTSTPTPTPPPFPTTDAGDPEAGAGTDAGDDAADGG